MTDTAGMKRWALVTALLYVLILAALFPGFWAFAVFFPDMDLMRDGENYALYLESSFWLIILLFFLVQLCLLVTPVARESRRPLKQRHVASLILSTGIMFALLVYGLYLTIGEVVKGETFTESITLLRSAILIVASWLVWALIFSVIGKGKEPGDLFDVARKRLLQGSILELLIVVPCHIYVRTKDYCCAGFSTFWGIAFGVSVMLFAFGPAVFILFAQQISHTRKAHDGGEAR